MADVLSLALFEREGRTLMVLRKEDNPPFAGRWLLPGVVVKSEQSAEEALERWPLTDVAMQHRTGRLEIGETSLLIAVSSPHRKEAFAACHHLVDRFKETVPIWKKEVWEGGEVWIEGEPVSEERR